MGNYLSGTGRRKRLVVVFLLLSSSLFSMELSITPEKPRAKRPITLSVDTEIRTTKSLTIKEDLVLPEGFTRTSGPIKRGYNKRVDGRWQRFYRVSWTINSSDSGIFNLNDVVIESEGDEILIETPTLMVYQRDELGNKYPLIVRWNENIKREIYLEESLPLVIEAINLENIIFHDRVVSREPRNGRFVQVSGIGGINQESIDGDEVYSVSIQSWIYTPFKSGKVVIPSVRVDINGLTRYTEELVLNVVPVPEGNKTAGVGEFIISSSIDEKQVTPEDSFKYTLTVEGMGNLPFFKFPQIDYEGLILLGTEESDDIRYGEFGYMGRREITYEFQAIESGVKEIKVPALSWIDWDGNPVYYNGTSSNINVISTKIVEEEIKPYLSLLTTPEIIDSYRINLYKIKPLWLFLLLSPLLLLITVVVKKIKLSKSRRLIIISLPLITLFFTSVVMAKGFEFQGEMVAADNMIEEGDYQGAITIYDELVKKLPNNYGLYVNLSILWDKLDKKAPSVFNIRMAERIFPNSDKIQNIKRYLSESEEHYKKQAKTVFIFNPDYLFFVLLLFSNLLIYIFIRTGRERSITTISLLITLSLLVLFSGVSLFYVDNRNSVESGVILKKSSIKKVPSEVAQDWLELPEGYTVYIKGFWKDELLVETEYGLQGWINKGNILILEDI